MKISNLRNQTALIFAAVAFCGAGVSIAEDGTAFPSDSDGTDEQVKTPSDPPTSLPSITPTHGVTTQAVSGCGQYVSPGNWGVCGTWLLGETRIAVTNYSECWTYVYSKQLNQFATGVNDWIVIPPFGEVSFLRWFWGNNVNVYSWEGNCGGINVHH